jgi:hypothetical protein
LRECMFGSVEGDGSSRDLCPLHIYVFFVFLAALCFIVYDLVVWLCIEK